MTITHHFERAAVDYSDGRLTIDSTKSRLSALHYNVKVEIDPDKPWIKVTGEQASFDVALSIGSFDIDEITESSITTYKPWPWSKPRRVSKSVVEYKERKERTYESNHFLLIL